MLFYSGFDSGVHGVNYGVNSMETKEKLDWRLQKKKTKSKGTQKVDRRRESGDVQIR